MKAKDYHICLALSKAYIAKTSKTNPNLILEDRREITENEILQLIEWWLNSKLKGTRFDTQVITKDGKPIIELKLLKEEQ